MKDIQVLDCLQPELVTLERVNYYPRQLLTVDDLTAERDYILQKLRRHNRFLHGWGVACGFALTPVSDQQRPWLLRIGSGYALGPYGDEIRVTEPVLLDLSKCGPDAMTDPCDPEQMRPATEGATGAVYVAIKYAECLARPIRAADASCGCPEAICEYSRIRDSFQIACLPELPESHRGADARPSLCDVVSGRAMPLCPPCPADPWIVLGRVRLPDSGRTALAQQNIETSGVRRLLLSTALIQEQLIRCCCGGREANKQRTADVSIVEMQAFRVQVAGADESAAVLRVVMRVRNTGPDTAENVVLRSASEPPMGTAGIQFMNTAGWTPETGGGQNGVLRTLGALASGANMDLEYFVSLRRGSAGSVKFHAAIESSTEDPDPGNNKASADASV